MATQQNLAAQSLPDGAEGRRAARERRSVGVLLQRCEPVEHRGLEGDAMVRPTVIGSDVHRGHFVAAVRFDRMDKRIRIGGQTIVGGHHQERRLREAGRGVVKLKFLGVRAQIVRHAFRSNTGERFHIVGHERRQALARHQPDLAHVGRADENRAHQVAIVRGGVDDHPASHAVASDRDAMRIIQTRSIRRIAEKGKHGVAIFKVLTEAKNTGACPTSRGN